MMFIPLLLLSVVYTEVFTSDFNLLDQDHYDLNNAKEIFKQFVIKYDKEYDPSASKHRFEIFKENLKKINRWNEESDSARFGVNQFTDMTFEEVVKTYTGIKGNASMLDGVDYQPRGLKGPSALDYRQHGYVTPVKNQLHCGSCYVFSAIGDIEGQYAKIHNTQAISLSEQQGLDCDNRSGGCRGGWPHYVFQALAEQGGSMREEQYPYEAAKGQCHTDRSQIAVRVTGGDQLHVASESDIKDALINYGPLSIAINVGHQLINYRGGVLNPTDCIEFGHAVLLVGYGSDGGNDYWLIKNSWGTTWGEQGYLRLVMGRRACDMGKYVAHSTVA